MVSLLSEDGKVCWGTKTGPTTNNDANEKDDDMSYYLDTPSFEDEVIENCPVIQITDDDETISYLETGHIVLNRTKSSSLRSGTRNSSSSSSALKKVFLLKTKNSLDAARKKIMDINDNNSNKNNNDASSSSYGEILQHYDNDNDSPPIIISQEEYLLKKKKQEEQQEEEEQQQRRMVSFSLKEEGGRRITAPSSPRRQQQQERDTSSSRRITSPQTIRASAAVTAVIESSPVTKKPKFQLAVRKLGDKFKSALHRTMSMNSTTSYHGIDDDEGEEEKSTTSIKFDKEDEKMMTRQHNTAVVPKNHYHNNSSNKSIITPNNNNNTIIISTTSTSRETSHTTTSTLRGGISLNNKVEKKFLELPDNNDKCYKNLIQNNNTKEVNTITNNTKFSSSQEDILLEVRNMSQEISDQLLVLQRNTSAAAEAKQQKLIHQASFTDKIAIKKRQRSFGHANNRFLKTLKTYPIHANKIITILPMERDMISELTSDYMYDNNKYNNVCCKKIEDNIVRSTTTTNSNDTWENFSSPFFKKEGEELSFLNFSAPFCTSSSAFFQERQQQNTTPIKKHINNIKDRSPVSVMQNISSWDYNTTSSKKKAELRRIKSVLLNNNNSTITMD